MELSWFQSGDPFAERLAVVWNNTSNNVGKNSGSKIRTPCGFICRDGFFDLGGDSLLATQVINCLCDTFGLELPLNSIFEFPTIANLARHIDTMVRAAQGRKEQHRIATGRRKEGEI